MSAHVAILGPDPRLGVVFVQVGPLTIEVDRDAMLANPDGFATAVLDAYMSYLANQRPMAPHVLMDIEAGLAREIQRVWPGSQPRVMGAARFREPPDNTPVNGDVLGVP